MKSRCIASVLCAIAITASAASQTVITLWPHGAPDPNAVKGAEMDMGRGDKSNPHYNPTITNISVPTMTVYLPPASVANYGVGVLVFPGGGYHFLNMKAAGTEPCAWANSQGMTCFLVKYRVPDAGHYPEGRAPLDDAQQAMRLVRSRAAEWHLDPKRIGVMGFSAGGNLALLMSTHADDPHVMSTSAAKDVPTSDGKAINPRANFAIVCWPAYVTVKPDETKLDSIYKPNANTPITFLIQAENDPMFHPNAIVYYRALMDANIPAELHYYATGGHAFGMNPSAHSQAHWPDLAATFLRFNKILPDYVIPTNTADPIAKSVAMVLLWPHGVPDASNIPSPEHDKGQPGPTHMVQLEDVSVPQIFIYTPPAGVKNTGAGIVVFPGGGFQFLQWSHAGTEACDWAVSQGITCFLVKYRVPSHGDPPSNHIPLDDGQQAMRLARSLAAEYHVDTARLGAMGFSAGGALTTMLAMHSDDAHVLSTAAAKDVPREGGDPKGKPIDARPSFAVYCWPGPIIDKDNNTLLPYYKPNSGAPPGFVIQAEDDPAVGVASLVLYRPMMDLKIPTELHMFQSGKHAFGMHPDKFDQAHWTDILANWMRFNKIIPGWTGSTAKPEDNPEAQ